MNLHPAILAIGFVAFVFFGAALATGTIQSIMPF